MSLSSHSAGSFCLLSNFKAHEVLFGFVVNPLLLEKNMTEDASNTSTLLRPNYPPRDTKRDTVK